MIETLEDRLPLGDVFGLSAMLGGALPAAGVSLLDDSAVFPGSHNVGADGEAADSSFDAADFAGVEGAAGRFDGTATAGEVAPAVQAASTVAAGSANVPPASVRGEGVPPAGARGAGVSPAAGSLLADPLPSAFVLPAAAAGSHQSGLAGDLPLVAVPRTSTPSGEGGLTANLPTGGCTRTARG